MEKLAIFPGSFDPITKGHVDVVLKGLSIFDRIIIGIGENTGKKNLFSTEQRMEWIKKVFANVPAIEVIAYEGLTINFCKNSGAGFILRGLRSGYDFEYEKSIAFANKEMNRDIETVFLLSNPSYSNISSTIVRDIIVNKGDFSGFVPDAVKL